MKIRIFRALVCFVIICAVVISISPIRAKAVCTEATLVYVGATLVCAAAITALGVQANSNVTGLTSSSKEVEIVLGTLGAISKDSFLTCLRVLDEAGKATYYMSCDLLESIRCALFDTGIVVPPFTTFSANSSMTMLDGTVLVPSAECVYFVVSYSGGNRVEEIFYLPYGGSIYCEADSAEKRQNYVTIDGERHYYYSMGYTGGFYADRAGVVWPDHSSNLLDKDVISAYLSGTLAVGVAEGFKAGIIPTYPIDGTSALKWSEEYGSRQLRVIPASGGDNKPDDSNDNRGKVWFPIALAGSIVEIAERTQEQQWTGETPQEFNDYTTGTELEILDTPQVDGFEGIEITPVPDPAPDAGVSPPPDSFEPDPDGGAANDYAIDLTQFFPFCIPFDLYEFLSLLASDPVAPCFEWVIPVPQLDTEFPITIDLSAWDSVARLFRTMELLAFIVGLALLTRNKILMG